MSATVSAASTRSVAPAGRRTRRRSLLLAALLAVVGGVVLPVLQTPAPVSAAVCDAPVVNEVACENSKPGSPASDWDISGSGSASIQGFATDISVNRGSTIGFKVKTTATSYRMDIYRMGYYGGMGARKITTINVTSGTTQPACKTEAATKLYDCGNWTQTASWAVPSTAVSGVYFAQLVQGTNESHIVFVVRDDASTSAVLFQTSDTTWQAYNTYGGASLYTPSQDNRAYKVSYNRPFVTRDGDTQHDWVFNAEYPTIRFLEANGYDVSYTTGVDSDRRGNLIKNHKTFLSVGHDEYWSGGQRANVEAARDAGVNLAFFSGNEVFWKTRWENSYPGAGTSTSYRTLVTYKETADNAKTDPIGSAVWTGTWRDPRFSPPGDGGRPENALTGTIFTVNCCTTDMKVDGVDGQMRFWRNTRVANLTPSQQTTLGSGILGYEWDESPDNGYRPAGLINLSTTAENVSSYLQDYGWSYAPGSATHHLTLYRAASGALVFGAGSIQWGWGLDDNHDLQTGTADTAVQQATVNLLADMGAQPATLRSGLVAASASTDTSAPTSAISAPAAGATVPVGSPVTISGTAADVGGGKVGGVEVSVDGGTSWHPATGRGSWSYTFTPGASGTLTLRTRATDDSLNTETPAVGRSLVVGTGGNPGGSCPCTIFTPTTKPAVDAADPDTGAIEVGVKFRASQAGSVTGIRFYKSTGATGTHVGSLWSSTGTKLASATFSTESASGWQQVSFANPVAVSANTTYVASYFAPNGRYTASDGFFTAPVANGPLTALQDNADGANGVYRYGASGFPTVGYSASNYWVDLVFTTTATADTTKPTVTSRTPAAGATGVASGSTVTATLSEPVTGGAVQLTAGAGAVSGTTAYDSATQRLTFTPAAALAASTTYTAKVSGATDAAGNVMTDDTWTFTTAAADTTPPTITGRSPADGATNVAVTTTVTATFSEALQNGTAALAVKTAAGAAVAGTVGYDAASRTARFTPTAALAVSTGYTVTASGAKDVAGNAMATSTWTFTTAASASACPCSIWAPTATPAVAADPDSGGIEVGLKFRTSQAGQVTGIRFYKGAGNTGTHVGSLWTKAGVKLTSVTFTGETASGWQQASFATPVSVAANTTYVVSYYAPAGHYAVTESAFATAATTRGPLTALKNGTDGTNGVYAYGATGFPTSSYKSSNYWVDVVFS